MVLFYYLIHSPSDRKAYTVNWKNKSFHRRSVGWLCCIVVRKRYTAKIELIIYQPKRFTSTNIISLALLVLRPKLVLLLTDVLQSCLSASLSASFCLPCLRKTASFILPRYLKSHGTTHYTTGWLVACLGFMACQICLLFNAKYIWFVNIFCI